MIWSKEGKCWLVRVSIWTISRILDCWPLSPCCCNHDTAWLLTSEHLNFYWVMWSEVSWDFLVVYYSCVHHTRFYFSCLSVPRCFKLPTTTVTEVSNQGIVYSQWDSGKECLLCHFNWYYDIIYDLFSLLNHKFIQKHTYLPSRPQ